MDRAGPAGRFLQRVPNGRIEIVQSALQRCRRHPDAFEPDTVEPLGGLDHGGVAPRAHISAYPGHRVHGRTDVPARPGQRGQAGRAGSAGRAGRARGRTPIVDAGQHNIEPTGAFHNALTHGGSDTLLVIRLSARRNGFAGAWQVAVAGTRRLSLSRRLCGC